MNVKTIAKQCGVTTVAVRNWLSGRNHPTPRNAIKLAAATGTEPEAWAKEPTADQYVRYTLESVRAFLQQRRGALIAEGRLAAADTDRHLARIEKSLRYCQARRRVVGAIDVDEMRDAMEGRR